MKKYIFILVALASCMQIHAQYRDVVLPEKPKQTGYRDYNSEESGFWCAFEADGGSSVMVDTPNMQYAGASFTGGYRINEFLRFGLGLGARVYVHNADFRSTNNKVGIPLFANVRGNFMSAYDRGNVPFWSVNIGGITNEGFFANPTIGYSFGGIRNNFLLGLSYTLVNFNDCNKTNRFYSYFGVKLGYEF